MGERVAATFKSFLKRLSPTVTELSTVDGHAASIEAALRSHLPAFDRLDPFGSHRRGSAIRGKSDVDFLAKVPKALALKNGERSSSTDLMGEVQKALDRGFKKTNVRTDGVAIVIDFESGDDPVDVVPAYYAGNVGIDGYPQFAIPDGDGGWLKTHPDRDKKYFDEAHRRSGWKIYRLAKLLKAWRTAGAARPVSGFYLEMAIAEAKASRVGESYSAGLGRAFARLAELRGAAIPAPLGLTDPIRSGPGFFDKIRLASALDEAASLSQRALEREHDGDETGALALWRELFGDQFPATA